MIKKKPLPLNFYSGKAPLYGLALTMLLSSCMKEKYDNVQLDDWTTDIAVPLISNELDIYDFSNNNKDGTFTADPDSRLISLVYKGRAIEFDAKSFLNLPDQQYSSGIALPPADIAAFQSSGQISRAVKSTVQFVLQNNAQLDSVGLKTGTLSVSVNSTFRHSGSVKVTFPTVRKNGVPVTVSVPLTYSGSSPVTGSQDFSLAGSTMDLTNGSSTYNTLPVTYKLELSNSGNTVTGLDKADIRLNMGDLNFSWAYGDMKKQTVSTLGDSIKIAIFNEGSKGYFRLTNPRLKLHLTNSFGFPININIPQLESVNIKTGKVTPILLTSFRNPFSIGYPSKLGDSAYSYSEINSSNSTISELIVPSPKYVRHKMSAVSNPNGTPSRSNFISEKSKIRADVELEMPLEGYAYDFSLRDTVSFSFGSALDDVESMMLRTIFDNGFPIDMRVQLYFADENFNILDSLTNNEVIATAGEINNEGKVIRASHKLSDFHFANVRMPVLRNTRKLIISGSAESFNAHQGQVVKLYDYYKLGVKLGIKARVLMNDL